jgi:hypothetical protein
MNPQKKANCEILGDGTNPSDSAHVSKRTPLSLKKKEIENDPRYRTEFESGIDPKREAATTKARRDGQTRPLGGR